MGELNVDGVGGRPLEPINAPATAAGGKASKISVPSIPKAAPAGTPSLEGRVKVPVEKRSNEELLKEYGESLFWSGYELIARERQGLTKAFGSWRDEANERANLGHDLAAATGDSLAQGRLALRHLVGMGTEPSEEKFLRVVRGQNPQSGLPVKGWSNLTDDPTINYQYFRFLQTFEGVKLLDEAERNPKALVLIEALEKAAEGGHPRAKELWNGDMGKALRGFRYTLENALEKGSGA